MQKYGNNYLSVDDDSDDLNSDADDDSSSDSDSDDVLSTYERSIIHRYVNSIQTTNHVDEDREYPIWERRNRRANTFGYKFGNIYHSNYYCKFLQPSICAQIYEQSHNRSSTFRSLFRMPLSKIDYLTDLFISRGWVTYTHRCREPQKLFDRTQILMTSLEHMGNRRPFRQFPVATELCPEEHRRFFLKLLNNMSSCADELVILTNTKEYLIPLMKQNK